MNHIVDRPASWSRRANAPYYRERYALEVKHILDEMILSGENGDKEPRLIKYTDYPEISHTTLYLKINQAMLYLLEKMDTEDKMYAAFRQIISISRVRSIGIKFAYNHEVTDKPLSAFKISSSHIPQEKPKVVERKDANLVPDKPALTQDWKATLHAFVEKAEVGQTLKLNGLSLTMEDGEYIKGAVPDSSCILYKATVESLFCVKMTEDEYTKSK